MGWCLYLNTDLYLIVTLAKRYPCTLWDLSINPQIPAKSFRYMS